MQLPVHPPRPPALPHNSICFWDTDSCSKQWLGGSIFLNHFQVLCL